MVHIEVFGKQGFRIDERRLFEEERHVLLPRQIGSDIKALLEKNLDTWREIKITVK